MKELRSFLGLASYYRKFVKQFAFIAQPLTNLLQKDVKWTWSKNTQQAAFRELKKRLTSTPVLLFPDFNLGFTIQTDSSGYAIGGVLLQDQGNGLQPIAYESRKMIPAETDTQFMNKNCWLFCFVVKSGDTTSLIIGRISPLIMHDL